VPLATRLLQEWRASWRTSPPGVWLFANRQGTRPIDVTVAQKIYTMAKLRAGIQKHGGIHALSPRLRHPSASRSTSFSGGSSSISSPTRSSPSVRCSCGSSASTSSAAPSANGASCSPSPSCCPSASPGIRREHPRRSLLAWSAASTSRGASRPLARAPSRGPAASPPAALPPAGCRVSLTHRWSPTSAAAPLPRVYAPDRAPAAIESPYVMRERGLVQLVLSAMRGARRIKA